MKNCLKTAITLAASLLFALPVFANGEVASAKDSQPPIGKECQIYLMQTSTSAVIETGILKLITPEWVVLESNNSSNSGETWIPKSNVLKINSFQVNDPDIVTITILDNATFSINGQTLTLELLREKLAEFSTLQEKHYYALRSAKQPRDILPAVVKIKDLCSTLALLPANPFFTQLQPTK